MVKKTGLNQLSEEISEFQKVINQLNGELGKLDFDPHDPSSIEAAIRSLNDILDERAGKYSSNPMVASLIDQMKESYREQIVQEAATHRLRSSESE